MPQYPSIYDDPCFRLVHGFPPIHAFYAIDYTDGHVELFSSEPARAAKLAKDEPGTVDGIRILHIPVQLPKSFPQANALKNCADK